MKQLRDGMYVKRWRVSWTDKLTKVRLVAIYSSQTRSSARVRAQVEYPDGIGFKVGPHFGGVDIPEFHRTSPLPEQQCISFELDPVDPEPVLA